MMEYAGAFDDRWYDEYRQKIEGMTDLKLALPLMEELVDRLHDYHTSLHWAGKPPRAGPGLRLGMVEEQIVVLDREPPSTIAPGDILRKIDGAEALALFRDILSRAKGATKYARRATACSRLLAGAPGSSVTVTFSNPKKGDYEVTLTRTGRRGPRGGPVLSARKLDEDTGYLRITRWNGFRPPELDTHLEAYRTTPYLIIDVRGNPGGSDGLAEQVVGRFIAKPVICSISFTRESGTDMYKKWFATAKPRGPWQYTGAVAVLINEGCTSATEHFVSGMYEAGALLVGTPTTGACGWSKRIDLGSGVSLRCSLTFPLHGKVPSPLHGMEPHELVVPTLGDIRAGRDTVLEQARTLLKAKRYERDLHHDRR
jgi:C-terminal processing protease CtpA/Prc